EGVTEAELAGIFEASARKAGIDEFAFQSIVASKPSNSFPHVYPGLKRVGARDLVLFDVGVKVGGRCSDVTRMVVLGRPEDEEERALRAVEEALDAALERLAPGAKARDVHDVAVKVLEKHGLERHFIHGLGHGVGLAVHEPPYIREGSEDVLEPGMVVTIEPGVYFPNRFGVRIEEDVLITERGHEVITGSLQRIFRV
ncbi:MAG: M24 family metallopeptidase, partial [Desulfurococcaceae archaeon]